MEILRCHDFGGIMKNFLLIFTYSKEPKLNSFNASQEEHRRLALWKPKLKHSSTVKSPAACTMESWKTIQSSDDPYSDFDKVIVL